MSSWRDFYVVHSACEAWPRMSKADRGKLADSLNAVGLRVPIQTREVAGDNNKYLIDGRERLDTMEQDLGWQIVDDKGEWIGALASTPGVASSVIHRAGLTDDDVIKQVVAHNARRRHQTKQELVESIDRALKAVNGNDSATVARSFSPVPGQKGGSTKGHTGKVVELAKESGVSERTTKLVLAKVKSAPQRRSKTARQILREISPQRLNKQLHNAQVGLDKLFTERIAQIARQDHAEFADFPARLLAHSKALAKQSERLRDLTKSLPT